MKEKLVKDELMKIKQKSAFKKAKEAEKLKKQSEKDK